MRTFNPCPKPKFRRKKRKSLIGISKLKFGKEVRIEDPEYHKWIWTLRCTVESCQKPGEPHHVNEKGKGSMGSKTDDTREIPLCHSHHVEIHQAGRDTFASRYNLNYEKEIRRLNKLWQNSGK